MVHYQALDKIGVPQIAAAGLSLEDAARFHSELNLILREYGAGTPQTWSHISQNLLRPDVPFSLHQMMYYGCYNHSALDLDPPPAWIPDMEAAKLTNLGKVLEKHGKYFLGTEYRDPVSSFSDFQKFSVSNPEAYWKMVLNELRISFSSPPTNILRMPTLKDDYLSNPGGQWLHEGVLNAAGNCLIPTDKKKLEDVMVIWRNEGEDNMAVNRMTLKELQSQVYLVANALESLGFVRGSAVAIDMPMTVTAVIIYLAIVLAGYIVVSIADSFASHEISSRLKISNAKAVFTQVIQLRDEFPHLSDTELLNNAQFRADNPVTPPRPTNELLTQDEIDEIILGLPPYSSTRIGLSKSWSAPGNSAFFAITVVGGPLCCWSLANPPRPSVAPTSTSTMTSSPSPLPRVPF